MLRECVKRARSLSQTRSENASDSLSPSPIHLQRKRIPLDEELIKTKKTSDICTDAVLNNNSPLSRRFKTAFSEDALTSGWTPRSDFDVMLYHDTKDDVVPIENYYAMSKFLKDHGVKTEELVGDYSAEVKETIGVSNHETAALTFFAKIIQWVTANYKQAHPPTHNVFFSKFESVLREKVSKLAGKCVTLPKFGEGTIERACVPLHHKIKRRRKKTCRAFCILKQVPPSAQWL